MSGHRRTAGLAASFAAAALAAGPALAVAPAYAAGQSVSFTGGSVLSTVVCKSQPSPARLTVPAESRVTFANRLGQTATLQVNGQSVATVGPNEAVPVVFHYGPVEVSMTFSCSAGVVEKFSPATVSVTPAPRAAAPNPVPAAKPAGAVGHGATSGHAPGTRGGSGATHASTGSGGAARAAAAQGAYGSSGTGGGAPNAAGPGASAVPSAGPSSPGPSAAAIPAADPGASAAADAGSVAVGAVVPASGTPRDSASGLLTVLAAVCVVGVTVAATRAIISKRTIQARYA